MMLPNGRALGEAAPQGLPGYSLAYVAGGLLSSALWTYYGYRPTRALGWAASIASIATGVVFLCNLERSGDA